MFVLKQDPGNNLMSLLLLVLMVQLTSAFQCLCDGSLGDCTGCNCDGVEDTKIIIKCFNAPSFPTKFHPNVTEVHISTSGQDIQYYEILSGTFSDLLNLETIYLQDLWILNIASRSFDHLPHLYRILFRHVNIQHIETESFYNLNFTGSSSQMVFLDCNIKDIFEASFSDIFFVSDSVQTSIIFGNSLLVNVYKDIFHNIENMYRLVFNEVDITSLATHAFSDVTHVPEMTMKNVTVEQSSMELFSDQADITFLSYINVRMPALTGNLLATTTSDMMSLDISSSTFTTLTCSVWDPNHEPLHSVIADNHVTCDCRLNWLQNDPHTIPDEILQAFSCSAPEELQGQTLYDVIQSGVDLPCDGVTAVDTCTPTSNSTGITTGVLIAILVGFLLFILLVVAIVVFVVKKKNSGTPSASEEARKHPQTFSTLHVNINLPSTPHEMQTVPAPIYNIPKFFRAESGMYEDIDGESAPRTPAMDSSHYYDHLGVHPPEVPDREMMDKFRQMQDADYVDEDVSYSSYKSLEDKHPGGAAPGGDGGNPGAYSVLENAAERPGNIDIQSSHPGTYAVLENATKRAGTVRDETGHPGTYTGLENASHIPQSDGESTNTDKGVEDKTKRPKNIQSKHQTLGVGPGYPGTSNGHPGTMSVENVTEKRDTRDVENVCSAESNTTPEREERCRQIDSTLDKTLDKTLDLNDKEEPYYLKLI